MKTIYTWRDNPTGPPDEPTRHCGTKCEYWRQCPTDHLCGFCIHRDVMEHTTAGEECWL